MHQNGLLLKSWFKSKVSWSDMQNIFNCLFLRAESQSYITSLTGLCWLADFWGICKTWIRILDDEFEEGVYATNGDLLPSAETSQLSSSSPQEDLFVCGQSWFPSHICYIIISHFQPFKKTHFILIDILGHSHLVRGYLCCFVETSAHTPSTVLFFAAQNWFLLWENSRNIIDLC